MKYKKIALEKKFKKEQVIAKTAKLDSKKVNFKILRDDKNLVFILHFNR